MRKLWPELVVNSKRNEPFSMPERSIAVAPKAPMTFAPSRAGILQRNCACGQHTGGSACADCSKKKQETAQSGGGTLQRRTAGVDTAAHAANTVPPIVHAVLRSPGQPLDTATRSFFEPRFGYDLSGVRVHTDAKAADSANAVNALAYTVGKDVVFGTREYAPSTVGGRNLLAHELTHVVQQNSNGRPWIAAYTLGDTSSPLEREAEKAVHSISSDQVPTVALSGAPQIARLANCTPVATCSGGPITGSAEEADVTGTAQEVDPRARRRRMTPARAVATGHGGRALQLEKFLEAQAPGKLANLQGIFVDQDISPSFDATTSPCSDWINQSLPAGSPIPPKMAGAAKECTFVHDFFNQQALAFNTTKDATIGGKPRERWRAETLEILIHETEHPRFEAATSALANPVGVTSATCQRATVLRELSELAANLSEFPTVFQAASAETKPHGPLHQSMDRWFAVTIRDGGENIKSGQQQMGCSCTCPEVDAFTKEVFNFESALWTTPEKDAIHRELVKAKWGIRWPFVPSTP